jgi:hypothetical protein
LVCCAFQIKNEKLFRNMIDNVLLPLLIHIITFR